MGECSTHLPPPARSAPPRPHNTRLPPPSMFARSFLAAVVAMSAIAQSSAFAPSSGLASMSRRMPLRSTAPRALRRPGVWLCLVRCVCAWAGTRCSWSRPFFPALSSVCADRCIAGGACEGPASRMAGPASLLVADCVCAKCLLPGLARCRRRATCAWARQFTLAVSK